MPLIKYAILINDENIELITFLNGGTRPWQGAHGDFFVCVLPRPEPRTVSDEIVDADKVFDSKRNHENIKIIK